MRLMTYAKDSLVYLKDVELCCVESFDFEICPWPPVSTKPQIYK